jgi:uncharacterized membrane protein
VEELLLGLLAILVLTVVVLVPIAALILVIVLFRRVGDLRQRVTRLETAAGTTRVSAVPDTGGEFIEATIVGAADGQLQPEAPSASLAATPPTAQPAINWELLIGRKGLGWVAVVLLLFGTAFFLRYAYENQWIGPIGRVAIGLLAGVGLAVAGWRYDRRRWRIFSQMLSSGGVMVLFLSVYSAFGFYRLVPQQVAAAFLLAVIVESALLAVLYNAPALAWMSLLGGLLTPVLMRSDMDQYQSLFTYLAVLDAGMVVLALWRHWWGLATAALVGTQGLFWLWHVQNYHPEKLAWAIGFQLVVYLLFVLHSLTAHVFRRRTANWEDLARLMLNASLWFTAAYVLLRADYRDWLGLLAVGMAMVYVVLGRVMLGRRPEDGRQLLTALAAAVGFIALAFPIQARAEWIALGWAAEAAALWWFGLRTRSPALRGMAAAVAVLAVGRLVFVDTPHRGFELVTPIFNPYAIPALGVTACLLGSVMVARRFWSGLKRAEQILTALAGVLGVLLLWFVLSVDTYAYFHALADSQVGGEEAVRMRWLGQVALSALWSVYALGVLAVGFVRRVPTVRWTALFIFAMTIGKVFLHDMAGLKEIYRILAFFILAILLGLAGWAYQRIHVERQTRESSDHE